MKKENNYFNYDQYLIDLANISNCNDIKVFYKNLNEIDLNNISEERIKQIKESEILETFKKYYYEGILADRQNVMNSYKTKINKNIVMRYLDIIKMLITNPKIGMKNDLEKYILFILTVDPNLEVISMYTQYDNNMDLIKNFQNIKRKMERKYGIYDSNLIKVERKLLPLYDLLVDEKTEEKNSSFRK